MVRSPWALRHPALDGHRLGAHPLDRVLLEPLKQRADQWLGHAGRALLQHADPRMTQRIYRRKPEIV
jgi:hypothetical protein